MDLVSPVDESGSEPMSMDMLEDICGGSQSHPSINRRKALYKIRYSFKQIQVERKGFLSSMWNMNKVLNKVFQAVVNEISQLLPILGESRSEVSYFIPEHRIFQK